MSISWKLKRLRAMDGIEILYRSRCWISQRLESLRISFSWCPDTDDVVGPGVTLFPDSDGWRTAWLADFALDDEKLSALSDGQIDLFSYQSLDIGRPVNWHRDPLSGTQSPLSYGKTLDYRDSSQVGNVKVLWELGRHQHLIALASAFSVTGETKYRNTVTEQIEHWIEANPFGLGIHWCSSLEVALRLISWTVIHNLFKLGGEEKGLFSAVKNPDKLGKAIYQQAWFIRHHLSLYSSANNHLIGELTGLWAATQLFDLGTNGRQWGQFARHELEKQAGLQVHTDGVGKEQAIYYHLWVLEYLLFAWLVGERAGSPFSGDFRDRILRMSRFLRDISLEKRGPPQIGDSDDGFVTRFEPTWPDQPYDAVQDAIAAIFQKDATESNQRRSQKTFWYALISGRSPLHTRLAGTHYERKYPILYEQGGYAILGDDRVHLVFDAGPLGYPSIAAHGHADALSFCLAIDGDWWIVDPGTYAYHSATQWRDYFRGTAAHNTLVLNGLDQSTIGGPFLWLARAHANVEDFGESDDGVQLVKGKHDGYRGLGAIHRRTITYRRKQQQLLVVDQIDCQEVQKIQSVAAFFHFAPGVVLDLANQSCVASTAETGPGLRFVLDSDFDWLVVAGDTDPIQGWYSPRLGQKEPAAVLVGRNRNTATTGVKTRIEIIAPDDQRL